MNRFLFGLHVLFGSILAFSASQSLRAEEKPKTPAPKEVTKESGKESGITHGFLVCGSKTYIRSADGKVTWSYPGSTRDGWVLENGNVLLAVSKSKDFPGGGVVEISPEGKELFRFQGSQVEVNTVQNLADGRILLTEAGDKPRILEIDRTGKIHVTVAITAQTKDHHLQSRMARKLANGNYLVPQLLDKVVREYDAQGKVVWEVKTPNWPFTAIRTDKGNTLITCTVGNLVIEVDPMGKTIWELNNDNLEGKPIKDACGAQRLPNGNTVVTSYRTGGKDIRLFEVTPEKKIVWTHVDEKNPSIHHFQILDTNGTAISRKAMK